MSFEKIDKNNIPHHIAVIMDGNGRWAKKRGMSREYGHRAGRKSVKKIIESCIELGIKNLTLYAFSTENWNRPKICLLYTSPSPRDATLSRMPSSA